MSAAVPVIPPASDFVATRRQWWQWVLPALCAAGNGMQRQAFARRVRALRTLIGEEPGQLRMKPGPATVRSGVTALGVVPGNTDDLALAPETLREELRRLEQTPDNLTRRWLAQQTLALLEWLRGSCQVPAATALPALIRLCRQLQALLEIAQQPLWRERLRQMEIVLLAQYLRGQCGNGVWQQCGGVLWALHYGLPDAQVPQVSLGACLPPAQGLLDRGSVPWEPVGEIPLCMTDALQRMQLALVPAEEEQGEAEQAKDRQATDKQAEDKQAEEEQPPTGALILQGYELAVVALQLRATAGAVLFGCLQALLIEHWSRGLPLATHSRRRLRTLYTATRLEPESLRAALHGLVALWPPTQQAADLRVPLATDDGSSAGSVKLATIPTLLSRRLPALNAAHQSWFAEREAFAPRQLALQGELMMLERGAAAFRVRGVEHLCGRLLELLMLLDLQGALARFPGALLWRAHCHLMNLLDAAAAWWEATPDQALLQELQECSRRLLPAPAPANTVAEPAALCEDDTWHEVRRQLLGYVQSFSGLLEIQMRLDISGDGASWPVERLWRLQAALMPLLRYLLLEFSLALEQRKALRLPTTGCLWLCLQRNAEGQLQARLRDDSAHQVPGAVQWQQLQHRVLKHAGATIVCEPTPLGRCFTLTLPLAPAR